MLRLAHLVFGNVDQTQNNVNNQDMIQKDVDDDWILIDIGNNHNNSGQDQVDKNEGIKKVNENENEKENEDEIEDEIEVNQTQMIMPKNDESSTLIVPNTAVVQCQQQDNQTDPSISPIPQHIIMEESWFITPPPCFINYSNNPINIETTPFENLLIEHPSMSVFGPSLPRSVSISSLPSSLSSESSPSPSIRSSHSSPTPSSSNQLSSNNSVVGLTSQNNINNQQLNVRPSRHLQRQQQHQRVERNNINSFTSRTVALNQWQETLFSMQKSQTAQYQKLLTKNYMNRQNKVVYQNKRPQNRKIKMAIRPNGVYNNRKNC